MSTISIFNLNRFTSLAAGDVVGMVDVSDLSQSANGSTDAITITNFFATVPVPVNVTSASATALAVGLNGATNPAFAVDASTALQVAGLKVKGAVAGGTVAIVTTDSGAANNLTINALGTGTIGIGSVSTGRVTITPVTTITGALTLASTLTGGATSDIAINTNKFTVAAATGNTVVAGTLGVTGATTLSAALTYGGVTLSNSVTGTGSMVLSAAPSLTTSLTVTAASALTPMLLLTNGTAYPSGFTSSGSILGVVSSAAAARIVAVCGENSLSTFSRIGAVTSGGTVASPSANTNGMVLGAFSGGGYDGTNWSNLGGSMRMQATQTWTTSAHGAKIIFATVANGATSETDALTLGQDQSATFVGAVTHSSTTTLSGALTYGGVTLSNAVTGTGNMVLSASPTLTGTAIVAALTGSAALSGFTSLAVGTTPSTVGAIRLANTAAITYRDAANGANLTLIESNASDQVLVDSNAKGTIFGSSIKTSAPTSGTAAAWKLGTVSVTSPTSPNRTIELDVAGTIYYLAAKTTNN